MNTLTIEGQEKINAIALQYHLSQDAVLAMLQAVLNGGGRMAQFNIYELGGGGQWMQGGMTMVGDMFNHSLKNKVNNLCQELANLVAHSSIFELSPIAELGSSFTANNWYPSELGIPSSVGSQNSIRYAIFPNTSRLAIEVNGVLSVYDTLNHRISGVSQQQQNNGFSIIFTSQFGRLDVLTLPLVNGQKKEEVVVEEPITQPISVVLPEPIVETENPVLPVSVIDEDDIFAKIERLAGLFQKGILTEQEYSTKKAELLARL